MSEEPESGISRVSKSHEPSEQMSADKFQQIRRDEGKLIRKRRREAATNAYSQNGKAGVSGGDGQTVQDASHPPEDLVGLALSGGGIRSASVGLGVLQALFARRRLREVDYLSTVSGGGYIGGYLSSAAVSDSCEIDDALGLKTHKETPAGPDNGLPPLVQRFIFGGKYLYRPWEAANKYLIGLLFTNLLVWSGLIALAAAIAFVWRSFDYQAVRNFLEPFYLNSDAIAAFLPFFFFLGCWTVAWLVSIFKKQSDAPGVWAQRFLYFAVGSLLVGIVLLLVNVETTVQFAPGFFGKRKLGQQSVITTWLIGLLTAGLAPFLAPKRLMQIGMNPQTQWQRVMFQVAMVSLLAGVPLLVVGLLATPNISYSAADPDDNLRPGDVISWPAFTALVGVNDKKLTPEESAQLEKLRGRYRDGELKKTDDKNSPYFQDFNELKGLTRQEVQHQMSVVVGGLERRNQWQQKLEKLGIVHRLIYFVGARAIENNPIWCWWDVEGEIAKEQASACKLVNEYVLSSRAIPDTLLAGEPLTAAVLVDERPLPKNNVQSVGLNDQPSAAKAPPSDNADQNPVGVMLAQVGAAVSRYAGSAHLLRVAFSEDAGASSGQSGKNVAAQNSVFDWLHEVLKKKQDNALANQLLDESLDDAKLAYNTLWRNEDTKDFNQRLLRALHPECFYYAGKTYRWLVIDDDQKLRLKFFGISFVVFLFACGLVNLNATSLHRFYRNRLKFAYLLPYKEGRRDFELSSLNTTAKGHPYHLINATIDISRPRVLDEIDAEARNPNADRRNVQTFLFSQLYCGCDATGWAHTERYETFRPDNINFADAIALSGSAGTPLRSTSLGIRAATACLNLGLGQWMPNPRFDRAPRLKPNFFSLSADWLFRSVEQSSYCYVSDGGFTDNLGIISLLRRRCRVIIAVDASCDCQDAFVDLNWVIRMARIRHGIKILQPRRDADGAAQAFGTDAIDRNKDGWSTEHFAVARIEYPEKDAKPAWLIYVKPSFTGDEGADLLKYRCENPSFPNDDTSDQFYEAARVESYRQLGFHMADDLCNQLGDATDATLVDAAKNMEELLANQKLVKTQDASVAQEVMEKAIPLASRVVDNLQDISRIAKANLELRRQEAEADAHDIQPPTSDQREVADAIAAADGRLVDAAKILKSTKSMTPKQRAELRRSIEEAKEQLDRCGNHLHKSQWPAEEESPQATADGAGVP